MAFIISPCLPFPPLIWWARALGAGTVLLDGAEHFVKATARNRYIIATANGLLPLSIPLAGGRGQRTAMKDVRIDTTRRWQEQHWRGLLSAYGRAPFFEHYAPELETIFLKEKQERLVAFCHASLQWLCKAANIPIQFTETEIFQKNYDAADYDWRFNHCKSLCLPAPMPRYAQVFEESQGFRANLSLLDLIMNEGPATTAYLQRLRMTL